MSEKILGVLGGMGPLATAYFLKISQIFHTIMYFLYIGGRLDGSLFSSSEENLHLGFSGVCLSFHRHTE